MPRFVLLKHAFPDDCPRATHWDLMLESDCTLRTWALEDEPSTGVETSAMRLADHRLAYLDYEGEVSGGRGTVTRVDQGSFAVIQEDAGSLQVALYGERLLGTVTLTRRKFDQWRLVFAAGRAADSPAF